MSKQSTQEKIVNTATELFLEKGFDRTSVRDIASRAKINISLMNYYFRSKEILFETIIELLIGKNADALKQILDADMDLEEKVRKYISFYIDMLISNPLLISFIIAVLHRNPEKLIKLKITDKLYNSEIFIEQLKYEHKKGNISNVDPDHFYINMLSLIAFPFAIKELIMHKNKYSDQQFDKFIRERKEIVYANSIVYLKSNNNLKPS